MIAKIDWKLNNRSSKSLCYLTNIEYCEILFIFDCGGNVVLVCHDFE